MDPFHYDAYTSYSDASTPRTPSPRSDDFHPLSQSPAAYKTELDPPVRNIFSDPMHDEHGVTPEGRHPWQGLQSPQYNYNGSRGSLLSELYDHDVGPEHHIPQDIYVDHDAYHQRSEPVHAPEIAMMRRATYPYVRQDRDDVPYPAPVFIPQHDEPLMGPYTSRTDTLYGEPLPMMDNSPQYISLGPAPSMHSSMSSSPASSYHEFDKLDPNVKLEESAPVIVPSQTCLYRPSSSGPVPPMSYLSPHTGLPVQHTDDAASKETQYLRRRCFNCSQTEPPSWRRSTLNPGKIVCNKCGLYERTHLRPRPLRFDELRTGNKSRKQSKTGAGSPASKAGALVKKEESETMSRRASVSSSCSAQSSSDWDDSREHLA
ncbi:hypothetical protein EWM64_g3491 [Hericium alpestre]|uniref:GATA-type domain-containing protein n=1 Tax=Hericium alpestre TaxID=135208 RepID=A0A4Z0A250_9AGAM|nr:hypothetical protein EWM64_g3491 [Hericium alpestre]